MSTTAVATRNGNGHPPASAAEIMEQVIVRGDLAKLTPEERGQYYMAVCKSVGLNPLTKPFEYITLNGKLTLYALRNCTDQLRSIYGISVVDMTEADRDGVAVVTCKVANKDGRTDIAKGAVNLGGLKGEALANAIMKAETKAKRRATLSICGLGLLDETEIEDIPSPVKSLPKKDARPLYSSLQNEINLAQSVDGLKKWGEANRDRIDTLPNDWRDILRAHYSNRLVELRQLGVSDEPKAEIPQDIDGFLDWANDQLATVSDASMLDPTYSFKIEPHIPEGCGEDVLAVYRQHEARLSNA